VKMLRLITSTVLLISFGAAAVPRQESNAPHETGGLINGRSWLSLSEAMKVGWLVGYTEGLRVAPSAVHGEPCTTQVKQVFDLYPQQLSFGEILKAIDHFYEDTSENSAIPVPAALQYVTRKASGATQTELDELASGLRKKAAQP
jgi:hypothetical protein